MAILLLELKECERERMPGNNAHIELAEIVPRLDLHYLVENWMHPERVAGRVVIDLEYLQRGVPQSGTDGRDERIFLGRCAVVDKKIDAGRRCCVEFFAEPRCRDR